MRRFLAVFLTAILGMGLMPLSSWADESQTGLPESESKHTEALGGPFAQGELLVEFDDAFGNGKRISSYGIGQMLSENDVAITEEVVSATQESGTIVLVEIGDQDILEAIERIGSLPGISRVQRNFVYHLPEGESAADDLGEGSVSAESDDAALSSGGALATTVNDPRTPQQYYLKSWEEGHGADLYNAWDFARCDSTVAIAILDTGIRVDHEDLNGNILTDCMRDIVNNTEPGTITSAGVPYGDNVGHGTHVAGIAAAIANNDKGIAGASYNANILPIKVFSDESYQPACYTKDLVKAYNYLFDLIEGGKVEGLHVVNMSLGGYGALDEQDLLLEQAIETARDSYQILTVAAGGNGNSRDTPYTAPSYPSDFDACMAVTALNSNGANVVWSDYNQYKDISASGYSILSTYNQSSTSYGYLSGTSMASPLVAGSAALLWGAYPTLTVDQVKTSIYETANPIDPASPNYRGSETGSHGAIDAAAAIAYARDNYTSDTRTSLAVCTVDPIADRAYTGSPVEPTGLVVKLADAPEPLVEGADYRLTYGENTNIGTGSVTIAGMGAYAGYRNMMFSIKYDIGEATIEFPSASYAYTGEPITPEPKVVMGGRLLSLNIDYQVTYGDNIEPGTAVVTVFGLGDYMGSKLEPFIIVDGGGEPQPSVSRLGGEDRYGTMALVSKASFPDVGSCPTVIVARGDNFPDALAAAGLAGVTGGQVLLTETSALTAETKAEIERLGAKRAFVIGDEHAVTARTFSEIRSITGNATRLGGENRLDTAVKIYKAGGSGWGDTAIVATGKKAADSLSASPLAYNLKAPIFLADDSGNLQATALDAIAKGGFKRVIVLGDQYSVSKGAFDKVKATAGAAERIGGANRYVTSQLTAEWAFKNGFTCKAVALTAGRDGKYADALVASSLGGRSKSVLLLVDDGSDASVCVSKVLAPNRDDVGTAYVLGDKYTVSDTLYEAIQGALA